MKKISGIGLLELMLALAVIAMMMVAATKYYKSTQTARRAHVAMETVKAVYSASERHLADGYDRGDGTKDVTQELIDKGYLPTDFDETANPWGGGIRITFMPCAGSGSRECSDISFGRVPSKDCWNAKPKLENNLFFVSGVECESDLSMYVTLTKTQ